jgi:predicted ATP-grasp superfamily ATP-dependent carboligase
VARIYIGGAGGAPSNNVIRSLRESRRDDYLIGATSTASDLLLADTDEKHVVPHGNSADYRPALLRLFERTRPDFMHVQADYEVRSISRMREDIQALGVRLFLPDAEAVETCVDKYRSYEAWRAAGIPVPRTILLHSPADLDRAFDELGPRVWIRATVGAAGRGALPTDDREFAARWIEHFGSNGGFTAAECLTPRSVTWLSIWFEGELVVAQTRGRRSWNFGDRTLSGVTGITGVGETLSNPLVDEVAQAAIRAVMPQPHGVFGVDMTYDNDGVPNPTEINIGRFFTTSYFFTKAGLNMAEIYCDIALDRRFPDLPRKINPLPDGLCWVRGMDVEPVLTTTAELEAVGRWS